MEKKKYFITQRLATGYSTNNQMLSVGFGHFRFNAEDNSSASNFHKIIKCSGILKSQFKKIKSEMIKIIAVLWGVEEKEIVFLTSLGEEVYFDSDLENKKYEEIVILHNDTNCVTTNSITNYLFWTIEKYKNLPGAEQAKKMADEYLSKIQ